MQTLIKGILILLASVALGYTVGINYQKDKQLVQQNDMESLCLSDSKWESYLAFESDIQEYTCFKQNVQTSKIVKQMLVTKSIQM